MAKPMSKPPERFATSVPSGSVGNNGFRNEPSPQRSQAPIAAPPPTATNPLQGMQILLAHEKDARQKARATTSAGVRKLNAYSATSYGVLRVGIISLAAVRGGMPSPERKL